MLQNFSHKFIEKKMWLALALPVWVLGSFILVQALLIFGIQALQWLGVSFAGINPIILNTAAGAIIYVLTIAMVIGLPWLVKKYKTTRAELGIDRPVHWLDFLLAPGGFIAYIIISGILVTLAGLFLHFIDLDQVQDTGFNGLSQSYEYALAFVTLVVVAPVAEEVLFRGYLLGKLRQHVSVWLSILITSALFGLVHFAWNVGIDVFALSIVLCLLRIYTKRLWPSIMLHMLKNGLAFYILFINPTFLSTLGG